MPKNLLPSFSVALLVVTNLSSASESFSGIRPDLAHTNSEREVGIGAVVPWAGSLWTNTYGPTPTDRTYPMAHPTNSGKSMKNGR